MGLEQLSPSAQAEYNALISEIERSVRSKNQARGTFYSGQAGDEEVRAKADLLAKLAAQDTALQATSQENARNREAQERSQDKDIKAGKRNALVNLLGAGVGSAATLGGLAYMNKPGVQFLPDGKGGMLAYDAATKTFSPVDISGGRGAVGAAAGAPSMGAAGPGGFGGDLFAPPPNTSANLGPLGTPPGSAPPIGATAPKPPNSMWQNATGAKALGAGALGGGLGYLAARGLGADSTAGAVGSGVGGLGGYMAYSRFGSGNPYMAGLAALGGSLGGGLLGNLFK